MAKDKRRNSEKRKEKSRDAARSRRGKETEVFMELAQALPLQDTVTSQMDKASVMRLAISWLKIHAVLHGADEVKSESVHHGIVEKEDHLYQKALEGFAFILSQEGDIVYLTETVAKYLGLQQLDLMGMSIYEFTHPCDHDEIKEMLTSRAKSSMKGEEREKDGEKGEARCFFLRMKCTLTSKGRSVNLKSASYKVMKCSGRLASLSDKDSNSLGLNSGLSPYMVAIAEPIPHPANIEVPLDSQTFVSKHNMDMRFMTCDDRILELAGYNSEDMIDQSFYNFHHAMDSDVVDKAFKDLFAKGQTVTGAYRLLARRGGYVWVLTQATVLHNTRTQRPQAVVCVHYVLSGVEQPDMILSNVQQPLASSMTPVTPPRPLTPACLPTLDLSSLLPPKMELNTENIFAPRTKDMDTAYFVPPEMRESMRYLNNEPEDLSYLAPNAGDESIPFWNYGSQVLVSDSVDEDFLLKQEPATRANTPDPTAWLTQDTMEPHTSSSNSSSRISSPNDYVSMSVPENLYTMDKFFQNIKDIGFEDNENIDFESRAPYIPMDAGDDHCLIPPSESDLFSFSNNINPGFFGRTESIFGAKDEKFEGSQEEEPPRRSVRDMLDGNTTVAHIESPANNQCQKLKRPLDFDSLETGPPAKVQCVGGAGGRGLGQVFQTEGSANISIATNTKDSASVLMNLLLHNEDKNSGYKVNRQTASAMAPAVQGRGAKGGNLLNSLLPCLSHFDYEVNAPAGNLLQGIELYNALDI